MTRALPDLSCRRVIPTDQAHCFLSLCLLCPTSLVPGDPCHAAFQRVSLCENSPCNPALCPSIVRRTGSTATWSSFLSLQLLFCLLSSSILVSGTSACTSYSLSQAPTSEPDSDGQKVWHDFHLTSGAHGLSFEMALSHACRRFGHTPAATVAIGDGDV